MMYAIYEEFFEDVDKKLQRIAKKCQKCGNDFVYKVTGTEIREKENDFYKFYLVEVEGTAKINDWECVAVLDIHNEGNIIRRINTEIAIPGYYKTSENICDHCGSKRNRKNLYVIHNVATDDYKQVGGDCLKLYTGGLSLEYVTAWMDGITSLEENNDRIDGVSRKCYYTVTEVLEMATEIIEKMGYVNSGYRLSTKSLVSIMVRHTSLADNLHELNKELVRANVFDQEFTKSDFYKEGTEDRVKAMIEYYKNLSDDSEFIHNIKIMLNEGYIEAKNFGFLCYIPEGYRKYQQEEEKRAKRASEKAKEKTDYYGEIGKRYKNIKVQSMSQISAWENAYGITYLYKIVLDDYQVLMWKASSNVYLQENQKIDTITFTVKDHTEYKGEKQTQVTRCKVTITEK